MTDFMRIHTDHTQTHTHTDHTQTYIHIGRFFFLFFFVRCNPVSGKYLSVSCEKEIVVSIWDTRKYIYIYINWLNIYIKIYMIYISIG